MSQQGGGLENICNYSFPGNHLVQFSLVKQDVEQSYKKKYFFFITCAPGEQGQNGRTFNFQNRITMKVEIDKALGLSHAIRGYANGRDQLIGQYGLYVDGSKSSFNQGGGSKMVFINKGQDNKGNVVISLTFKQGQAQGFGYGMNIPNAVAMADVIEMMCKKGLELEFSRKDFNIQRSTVGVNQNANQNNFNNAPQPAEFNSGQGPQNTPQNVANNFSNTLNSMTPNATEDDVPF